jgi:hypothetical protein
MRSMLAAIVMLGSAPAYAQPSIDPDVIQQEILAAQAQAQAAAVHPGDEALSCEQLAAEFTANMNDPAMRQGAAELGQWAQQQQSRADAARGQAMAMAGVGVVGGIVSSFIPGAAYAQQAMMMAQARAMQAQAAQSQQELAAQTANMQAMLPAAYRGQRLYELAQAKQCAFLQGAPAPQ